MVIKEAHFWAVYNISVYGQECVLSSSGDVLQNNAFSPTPDPLDVLCLLYFPVPQVLFI